MLSFFVAMLLACSGGDGAGAEVAAAAKEVADPCCHAGEPGEARWEECQDKTVLEHVCARADICCTVQWAEPCASGYAQFASTCTAEAVSQTGGDARRDPGQPAGASGPPQRPISKEERLTSLDGAKKVNVTVTVDMVPPPEKPGGSVFYGGFVEIDERAGMPLRDSTPADYGAVGRWVQEFPIEKELELVEGLHYFVMYGFGEHPLPGDRMTPLQQVTGPGKMSYVIEDRTIQKEGETPPGGQATAAGAAAPQ